MFSDFGLEVIDLVTILKFSDFFPENSDFF